MKKFLKILAIIALVLYTIAVPGVAIAVTVIVWPVAWPVAVANFGILFLAAEPAWVVWNHLFDYVNQ